MVWEQVLLAGIAGADAFALVKYVQTSRKLSAIASKNNGPSAPVIGGDEPKPLLSERLEAIKMAVGEPGEQNSYEDTFPVASASSSGEQATYSMASSDSVSASAPAGTTDEKFNYVFQSLNSHSDAIRKLNLDMTSVDARIAALDRRYPSKIPLTASNANSEISVPMKKKAAKKGSRPRAG